MTESRHSRKVSVSRRNGKASTENKSAVKAVAVRLKADTPSSANSSEDSVRTTSAAADTTPQPKDAPVMSPAPSCGEIAGQAVSESAPSPADNPSDGHDKEHGEQVLDETESATPVKKSAPQETSPQNTAKESSADASHSGDSKPAAPAETASATPVKEPSPKETSPQNTAKESSADAPHSGDSKPAAPAETASATAVKESAPQETSPQNTAKESSADAPHGGDSKPATPAETASATAVKESAPKETSPQNTVKESSADVPHSAESDPTAPVNAESGCTDAPAKAWYVPQSWREISWLRRAIMAAAVVLGLFSLLPLAVGVISPGMLPPLMIAAFFFLCALYWPLIDGCESTLGNVLIAVVAVCVLAGVTYLSFVSGKMISASANVLPEDRADVTVVVLGCKVNGDRPSRMLNARLEKAAEFLLEHPGAHCIVTGGKGPDEDYPEAYVMKNYLVDKGISPMRIIMEDKSTSTLENINFAAELAEIYNCHERFLIVTDRFHQYRAVTAANDLGIVSYALNVETAWYLAMPYWFREMAAISRDWLLR